jgi:surface antigen
MKRNKTIYISPLVVLAVAMMSCATTQKTYQENPKAVLGAVLGAGAGAAIAAVAGGNPAAIVASAIGGGLVGGYVGKKLDDKDKRMAAEAAARAFEHTRTGESTTWTNPDSGNSGAITPTKTYQIANGQYCRRYTQEISIGGEQHETFGTACRRADGTWEVRS